MKKVTPSGLRIFKQEPFNEAFQRMVLEQLQQALLFCGQFGEKPDVAVHEIRKSTKRIRAIHRLYRRVNNEEVYRHSNKLFGHLSQSLADNRISAVNLGLIQLFKADKRFQVNQEFMQELVTDAEKHHQMLTRKIIDGNHADRYLADILTTEMTTMIAKPMHSCDFHDLVPEMRRTYSQGKKDLAAVLTDATTENLHELRKQVKFLWIHYLILRPIYPAYLGLLAHQLDILAQKLGLDHDLAELEQYLIKEQYQKDKTAAGILLDFIQKKRKTLQKTSLPLAIRLYMEKPRAMSGKMERYYDLYSGKGA